MRSQVQLVSLMLLAGSAAAAATTRHVPLDYPTIGLALGAAAPGDTVEIACGTYAEHDLVLKTGVVVRGEAAETGCVVIDAEGAGRVALGMRVTGVVLEGITFRGGFEASGPDFERSPAGPGDPAQAHAPPDHDYGGGGALFLLHPDVTLRNCRFVANEAVVHGGALRIQGGTVRMQDVVLEANVAGNQGGAVHAGDGALLELQDVVATGNRAAQGGAIYTSFSTIDASDVVFRSNRADGGGGALQMSRTDAALARCILLDNEARRGGAIAAYTIPGTTTLTAVECTFARNVAARGAAIAGPATLERSILAFHMGGPLVECALGDVVLSCCDVFANEGGDFVGCLADEEGVDGNFAADPQFCALGAGVVALAESSPCAPGASPCGELVGAAVVGCPQLDITTIDSAPQGLRVLVDSVEYSAPIGFAWTAGSVHSIAAPGPQPVTEDTRLVFASWSDGGAAAHDIVVPEGDGTFTVSYAPEHRLVMAADGNGTVEPASGWVLEGESVGIVATAGAGAEFARWVGEGPGAYTGFSAVAQVTMLGPVRQTAYFAPGGQFTLTMSSQGQGSVTPGSGTYPIGAEVAIDAVPAAGWEFLEWQGTGAGSYSGPDSSVTIPLYDDITQHAIFRPRMHLVTMTASGPGVVFPDTGDFLEGSAVEIRALPLPGYSFVEWIGSGPGSYTGTAAVASITVLGPITQTAVFDGPDTHPLVMVSGSGGHVTPASGDYPTGGYVTIQAIPNPGYALLQWAGSGPGSYTGTSATAQIRMLGPITQTATFRALNLRVLTMIADPGGTVTPPTSAYPEGTLVTITAFPDSGFAFLGWQGTGQGSYSGTANPATVTLTTTGVQQHARFAATGRDVTVTTEPPGQAITVDGEPYVSPQTFAWNQGTVHSLAVPLAVGLAPGERQGFVRWSDGVASSVRAIQVGPTTSAFVAEYRHEYQLTQPATPEGTMLPGTGWFAAGSHVQIEASPALNHAFNGWVGTGPGSHTGPDSRATIMMGGPITETATFAPLGFEFSLSASDTDPWANLAAAANGPREVHLWLTCADFGISAMEATLAASGSLEVFGFQPVGNVLNAGGATDLLLAIGNCPTGADLPIRLGRWTVNDNGGSLCLGAGAAGGYAAVECDPLHPGVAEDPVVIGFSSNGGAPCTAGEHGCGTGGGGEARVAALRAGWNTAAPSVVAEDALRLAPNPFRGAAEITLSLKADARVRLDVYDVAGRLVRRVTDEALPTGILMRRWDARDASGRAVPAGIYFVKLDTTTGFHAVRKIVFLGAR